MNGDFETGSLDPFACGVSGGLASIVSNANLCHSGRHCMVLNSSAWPNSVTQLGIPTTIGETYTFITWARASEADMATCYVTYQLNVSNTGPGFMTIADIDSFPNTEWILSTGTYVAVTESSNFYLNIYCPDLPQLPNVYFDDISLTGPGCPAPVALEARTSATTSRTPSLATSNLTPTFVTTSSPPTRATSTLAPLTTITAP